MTDSIAPKTESRSAAAPRWQGLIDFVGAKGWAWAVFEWARNPYYILVVIYVFAPYFARDVIGADVLNSGELAGLDPEEARQTANARGQATIAAVTKWAGLAAALTAPFLGAALDRGGRRKPVLAAFLTLIALMSWLLWYAEPGGAGLPSGTIMVVLIVAYVSYTYSEVTHNSMLAVSGPQAKLPIVSGLGLGLGNLASTLMFLALVLLFALPGEIGWPFSAPLFGLDLEAHEHMRIVGPLCAVWLVLFSIPFFLYAEDGGTHGASWIRAAREGATGVVNTLRKATHYREVLKFLVARMFYADAMAALLALGAVYVSLFLDWGFMEMTVYAIFASAWAFVGGLIGGWLDTRFGPKKALIIEVSGMIAILFLQLSVTKEALFFGLIENRQVWDALVFQELSDLVYLAFASVLAVTATASISSSRSMLVHLAPHGRSGEFFGLYAIAGTVTVWLGPLLVEIFTTAFNSQRIGMSSIAILFVIGITVLAFVDAEKRVEDEAH